MFRTSGRPIFRTSSLTGRPYVITATSREPRVRAYPTGELTRSITLGRSQAVDNH